MSSLGADTRLLWFSVICCLTKGVLPEEPYVYSISECRYQYSSINTALWLPGLPGVANVSLAVECQSQPQQALVSWSDGGLPWSLLTVEYYCTNSSNTTTSEELNTPLHRIIPTLTTFGVSYSNLSGNAHVVVTDNLGGSVCEFFGCFHGAGANHRTRYTFSTQTCSWTSGAVLMSPTSSVLVSYTSQQATPSLLTTTEGDQSPQLSSIPVATPTYSAAVKTTEGDQSPQLSSTPVATPTKTTTSAGSVLDQQEVWVVVASVLTAVCATLLTVVSCFLVRKKMRLLLRRHKATSAIFPDWRTEKLKRDYNLVRASTWYIDPDTQSIRSYFDPLRTVNESEPHQPMLIEDVTGNQTSLGVQHHTLHSGVTTDTDCSHTYFTSDTNEDVRSTSSFSRTEEGRLAERTVYSDNTKTSYDTSTGYVTSIVTDSSMDNIHCSTSTPDDT